ncbi:MAG: CocE/NonD family hydrolase [Acidimicrobiia bacterium]
MIRRLIVVLALCLGTTLAATTPGVAAAPTQSGGIDIGDGETATTTTSPTGTTPSGSESLTVQGGVEQVAVTGVEPEARVRLLDASGTRVGAGRADAAGAFLFRTVPPGDGYVVTVAGETSSPVRVRAVSDVPPQSLYDDQRLANGFGYVRTRDGTLLSVNVSLPGPVSDGPYPTVVEYSGYDPSNPNGRPPGAAIAQLFGFATVGVNLRGTGCSGGAWDYFEPMQSLDGYDVIEAVAAQPWVAHGKVGMVGISYSGITQLFVAATRPPHLAAITPLAALDDTYDTLYPGGIFNDGFGLSWATDRAHDAEPASSRWVQARIADGDATCEANQALRLQAPDVLGSIEAQQYRDHPRGDAQAPDTFVDRIDVPVFIAGSWQDEETGAHFAEMLDDFSPDVTVKATVMNGVHTDALSPELIPSWLEFLDFFVARRVPTITAAQRAVATQIVSALTGAPFTVPPDRFDPTGDYAPQLAAYEAEPMLKVRFDVGAGAAAGAPNAAFASTFASWPPPATSPTTWWLAPGGALAADRPSKDDDDSYHDDPAALPRVVATEPSEERLGAPTFDWLPLPDGDALAYDTAPLTKDTVMIGTGSVDLWLGSTARDTDLEVVISEVRPDGDETYVQSGWLRASRRALDRADSTPLLPEPTFAEDDVRPLPAGRLSLVRVPIYPFGHAFRTGSRVRITVQPPGGNKPAWAFETLPHDDAVTTRVGIGGAQASKVVLPVVDGIAVPTPLPACGTLRGQPCRPAVEP